MDDWVNKVSGCEADFISEVEKLLEKSIINIEKEQEA